MGKGKNIFSSAAVNGNSLGNFCSASLTSLSDLPGMSLFYHRGHRENTEDTEIFIPKIEKANLFLIVIRELCDLCGEIRYVFCMIATTTL